MLKTRRAYVRAIQGLPVARQRNMATDAGCGEICEHGEFDRADMDERDLWINSLRANDVAWVADLRVLVRTSSELGKVRVTADLAQCLASICGAKAIVEEGRTGQRSDSADWPNRLKSLVQTVHLINRSRLKIVAGAAKARKTKAARSGAGIVVEWRAPGKAMERKAALVLWQSRSFTNWQEARAALPDELRSASLPTLTRIFHPHGRDPTRKGQGGRPKQ